MRRQKDALIVRQPWQQLVRAGTRVNTVLAGQRYRVTFQLLDAEQLRAQQFRIPAVARRVPCAGRKSEPSGGYDILLAGAPDGQRSTGVMTWVAENAYLVRSDDQAGTRASARDLPPGERAGPDSRAGGQEALHGPWAGATEKHPGCLAGGRGVDKKKGWAVGPTPLCLSLHPRRHGAVRDGRRQ